jgi:hypothetical protein
MSQISQSLAALGGLALGGALLGGMLYWQSGLKPPATTDWRPPCITRLGPSYAAVAPTPVPGTRPARNILFGIDRSGSNSALADAQLDAAVAHAATLDPGSGAGILLITDRSDRSTTPDMPFEPGAPDQAFKRGELPCAPDCPPPDSLFKQKCLEQLDAAQDQEVAALTAAESARRVDLQEQRALRIHAWRQQIDDYTHRPGTSLLAFFLKVADLPPVRHQPERTTVVVLSDLEPSQSAERKLLDRFERNFKKAENTCPEASWLPTGLAGVEVVLVQSVRDGIDADLWARRWDTALTCAGVHVRRHRYSSAVPLNQLLDEPEV